MRVLAVLAALSTASAAAGAAPLRWQAPRTCPLAGDVEARIESRIGAPLDQLDHRIAVTITRRDGSFVARVELDATGDREDRTLAAASCDELVDAIAVIVTRLARVHAIRAVAVRPPVMVAALDPELPPAVELHAAALPAAPPARWTFGAHVAAEASSGLLPAEGWGGEVAGFVARGPARAELAYVDWARSRGPSAFRVDGLALDGVAIAAHAAALRLAWQLGSLPLRVRAGAELGWMRATGYGDLVGHAGPVPWVSAGGGLAGAWHALPWLAIEAAADLDAALERPRFVLDGKTVYEPGRLSERISLGIAVELP